MSTMLTPLVVDEDPGRETQAARAARELHEHLRTIRGRLIGQTLGIGTCLILGTGAISLAVIATADYWWELAQGWRAAWLLSSLALAVAAVILGWKRAVRRYTLLRAAAETEARLSQFGQRLRTTLDYESESSADSSRAAGGPSPASPSLLSALHFQTQHVAAQADWDDAIDRRPLFNAALVVAVIGFAWAFALIGIPQFRISTGRALLLPLEDTTVTYTPQTQTVKFGESVIVMAVVTGRPVAEAKVGYRTKGSQEAWAPLDLVSVLGPEITAKMDPRDRLQGKLIATLKDLKQDTEFVVLAGPSSLPTGSITVLQPLNLVKTEAHVIPPEYTGRKPNMVESLELKVLEGSNVELKLQLNRAAAEAKLVRLASAAAKDGEPSSAAAELPIQIQDKQLTGKLADLRTTSSFTLTARAADGMALDPIRFNIRVQLDRKPEIQFLQPSEELTVIPTAEVPLIAEADDDLGLHRVGILYQIGSGELHTLVDEDAKGAVEPFHLKQILMLEELGVTHQDAVTYYAFAEDNYFGKPRRTTTPLRFIDIRPFKETFQVVQTEGGGSCNCSSITLEELITRQRMGLSKAFKLQELGEVSPEATQRLSKSETELKQAASEFAEGMAARGAKLPALDDALKHMETAIAKLDAPQLADAISAEQQALAALIRARENVRKILKQSNSQSASASRKFDKQQSQKLRMPEQKKKEDQAQKLADARKKLEELAQKERKWSDEAKSACNCNNPSASGQSGKPSQSPASQSKPSSNQQSPQDKQASSEQFKDQTGDKSGDKPASEKTPAEVAADQKKLQAELEELRKELDKLDSSGQAARLQAKQAAESMQQAADAAEKDDGTTASKSGERSAEELEKLSEHLAAMNARDFGQRLSEAAKLAQRLAGRQKSLEEKLGQVEQDGKSQEGEKPGEQAGHKPGESDAKAQGGQGKSADVGLGGVPSSRDKLGSGEPSYEKTLKPSDREELAKEEQGLATQTEMLADLLDSLKPDAATEHAGVKQKLDQVQAENPPRDIAAEMRDAATDLQAARVQPAATAAGNARQRLDELSRTLGAARGEYAQPQLKELMALEEQLAQLQQQLKRAMAQGQDEKAAAAQKWQQLEPRLNKLADGDKRLAEALKKLQEGKSGKPGSGKDPQTSAEQPKDQTASTGGKTPLQPGSKLTPSEFKEGGDKMPEGFYEWLELGQSQGLTDVAKALQTKIQEAILAGALMDADQPVPPAYKELVEKYYRTLSDDLK